MLILICCFHSSKDKLRTFITGQRVGNCDCTLSPQGNLYGNPALRRMKEHCGRAVEVEYNNLMVGSECEIVTSGLDMYAALMMSGTLVTAPR